MTVEQSGIREVELGISSVLQEHIAASFSSLVDFCICPLERLQNMRFRKVYDTGLWISPSSHFTVIYTHAVDDINDCWFQIGVHGKDARVLAKSVFKGKYSGELSFSELNDVLREIEKQISGR